MALQGLMGVRGSSSVRREQIGSERRAFASASEPEALFFVHVPKCAGSSFRQVLKRWFGRGALFLDTHDEAVLARAVERLGGEPRAVAGHIPFGLHQGLPFRPCYVSLVRHPLERFVSLYRHSRRTPGHSLYPAASRMDLETFYDFTLYDPRARNATVAVQCYFLSRTRSFDEARTVIDRHFALLAPTERYGEFVAACAERFGRAPPDVPARNVGDPLSERDGARRVLERRIRADHGEDLRLYDYVCATFDARRGSLGFASRA